MCLFHLLIEFLKKPYLIEYSTKYIYSESSNLQMNNAYVTLTLWRNKILMLIISPTFYLCQKQNCDLSFNETVDSDWLFFCRLCPVCGVCGSSRGSQSAHRHPKLLQNLCPV